MTRKKAKAPGVRLAEASTDDLREALRAAVKGMGSPYWSADEVERIAADYLPKRAERYADFLDRPTRRGGR